MSVEIRQATPSWSLSWYIQKYVSWILRIRKERTEVGCCIPDEDVPQRKRHFVYGTRTRLWPPSRVESTDPNDDSNRVIMEVVPCVSSEEQEEEKEEEKEEEEESVGKVESLDKENVILESSRDPFHCHRRSEESIEYPSWIVQRQWDWSSDEEDCEGHSISVTALVHAEACWSDTPEEEEEEDKAEAAISSQDDASKEGEPVATKTAEAAAL
ncbi:histone-lysine N-methyltransferase SETD1B-like isoform X3 [Mus caroli]|uniref:Histone-lysine N-methyltransferase SETD1B-like isoform X3 n=1 Tax=Mus caroli TaxID=10089 RepID=A0A6P5PLJ7_MUSCR|nr:histone-lysine N-methyltransferase SETD1B-like isoform X3 [Mus caroli]